MRLPDPKTFRLAPPAWAWLVWGVALIVAATVDGASRGTFAAHAYAVEHGSLLWVVAKSAGDLWVALGVALLLCAFHPWRWRASFVILLGSVYSQLAASLIKWITGRMRPVVEDRGPWDFEWFHNGLHGLFIHKNLSTPSGHATAAFALAGMLALLVPRMAPLWFVLAALCGYERVASLSHWPTDVVLGAMLGVFGARLSLWVAYRVTGQVAVFSERSAAPLPQDELRSPAA